MGEGQGSLAKHGVTCIALSNCRSESHRLELPELPGSGSGQLCLSVESHYWGDYPAAADGASRCLHFLCVMD